MTHLKIFFFLFSLSFFPDSISKSEFRNLKKEIEENFKNKNYITSIPKLEKIILYSEEPKYRLWLGLCYFHREDLEIPDEKDDIFIRNKKILNLKKNYELSKLNILNYIQFLDEKNLIKTDSKISEYYFILSAIEFYLNNLKASENFLKKSIKLGYPNKELLYFNLEYLKN